MKFTELQTYWYSSIDSTQTEVKRLISSKQNISFSELYGCIIAASNQTAGYGRRKRVWQSYKGNLFATLAINKTSILNGQNDDSITHLCFITAIAIGNSILHFANKTAVVDLRYKWVNDIILNDCKVAGIIVENYQNYILIGIGVNIKNQPKNLKATSLSEQGIQITAKKFLRQMLHEIDDLIATWYQHGFIPIRQLWLQRAAYINQFVTLLVPIGSIPIEWNTIAERKKIQEDNSDYESISGIFLGITDEGSATLRIKINEENKFLISDILKDNNSYCDIQINVGDMLLS